jgi:hypothetical protein
MTKGTLFVRITAAAMLALVMGSLAVGASRTPATRPAGLRYHLENPEKWDPAVRAKIDDAMKEAVKTYNENGSFDFDVTKQIL